MTQTFAGQKIIVVGGTSGIGKAVAQSILQGGGTAVLTGLRQKITKKKPQTHLGQGIYVKP